MPYHNPSLLQTFTQSRSRSRSSHSHSIEEVYARSRRQPSPDYDSDDSDTDCDCNDFCRVVDTPARQRYRSPSLTVERPVIQQNISQKMINIFPRVIARRRSVLESEDYTDKWTQKQFDHNMEVFHRCSHRFGSSSYCPHCNHSERGRGRLRHGNDPDRYHTIGRDNDKRETYNIEKFMKSKLASEEALRKRRQVEAYASEARKCAGEGDTLRQFYANAGFDDSTPRQLRDRTDDDILREIAQCDADLKDCREKSLLDAQQRAGRNQWEAFESHEAYCSGALQSDGGVPAGWRAKRKQPKPILKKTVGFRARVVDDDEEDGYGARHRRWRL